VTFCLKLFNHGLQIDIAQADLLDVFRLGHKDEPKQSGFQISDGTTSQLRFLGSTP